MADEYILKETVLNYLKHHSAFKSKSEIIQDIAECEPADVAPVVHAYWRDTGSGQECSDCKEIQYGYDTGRHYCPNCGAKMDGGY